MSETKRFTPAEAKAWVESREWANGWNVEADATINAVEFADQYHANKELWDKLFAWLRDTDLTKLEKGKYPIVDGRLWVNILEYTPKSAEETKIEAHRKFIDLQYTFEGKEIMGLAHDVKPSGEYDPVKDKINVTTDSPIDYVPADPGRFFLYFPSDYHQPSIAACDPAVPTRKVVGKIEFYNF